MPPPKRDRGDATRSERKAKRRIAEDRIPDLPGEENGDVEELNGEEESSNKKRRRDGDGEGEDVPKTKKVKSKGEIQKKDVIEDAQTEQDGVTPPTKKSKKERKAEKKALMAAVAEQGLDAEDMTVAAKADANASKKEKDTNVDAEGKIKEKTAKKPKKKGKAGDDDGGEEKSSKAPRFIVFVGNLPFTATKASILAHFAKVAPKDVRNLTEKDNPSKSRGIAFIEFDGYDRMKTCLKLMHHSEFNDGKSAPRKINVELTAGGGGKTKARTEKIKEKNHKLQEERFRAVQENGKVRVEEKKGADIAGDSNIHPSRRGRMGM